MPINPLKRIINGPARYQTLADKDLIAACLTGDTSAWDVLIDRYAAFIYSLCLRAGMTHADAEDMFQDICVVLLNHLADLRDTTKIAGWLASTTKREIWRLKKRRGVLLASELGEGEWEMEGAEGINAASSPSPEGDVLAVAEQQMMREAMSRLQERCRRLLTLLYANDTPPGYAEIAAKFDLPIGSIGPTRARCLQNLRKLLAELDP